MAKRTQLRKSETKDLNGRLKALFGLEDFFSKKDIVTLLDDKLILKNEEAVFFYRGDLLIPTLKLLLKNNFLKRIRVDTGAIKFIARGADLMRPGIIEADKSIDRNDVIAIVDPAHDKALAVGIAEFSGEEIMALTSGKVVRNLHYVGDEIWQH